MNNRVFKKVGTVIAPQSSDETGFPSISSQRFLLEMRVVEGAYDPTPFSLLVFIGVGSS